MKAGAESGNLEGGRQLEGKLQLQYKQPDDENLTLDGLVTSGCDELNCEFRPVFVQQTVKALGQNSLKSPYPWTSFMYGLPVLPAV